MLNNEYEKKVYQDLMQEYYEENPCFNGEYQDSSLVEELMMYKARYISDCEMGG